MVGLIMCCTLISAQVDGSSPPRDIPATWTKFYLEMAKQYKVKRIGDEKMVGLEERPVFNWVSVDDFHGALFAWTEHGRPTTIASFFSWRVPDTNARGVGHEFASFSETEMSVQGSNGVKWNPPRLQMERLPDAPAAPSNANLLKLNGRRLAKDFSAHINFRGDRWDLRLLPTPLLEYQQPSEEILGGGLFAFVAFSTDPDILLLLEARKTKNGPEWYFKPLRFSDKSLYLKFKDKPIWESLRAGHGSDGPSTADPLYLLLSSERIPAETVEKLSPMAK